MVAWGASPPSTDTVAWLAGPISGDLDAQADAAAIWPAERVWDGAGELVPARDVDADGRPDLLVGVPGADGESPRSGAVVILSGFGIP